MITFSLTFSSIIWGGLMITFFFSLGVIIWLAKKIDVLMWVDDYMAFSFSFGFIIDDIIDLTIWLDDNSDVLSG
jgi:hypothetical protein